MTSLTEAATDVLIVRTPRGLFTWTARDGLQPSAVPPEFYKPGVVLVLLDPPPEYWAWLQEFEWTGDVAT